MNRLITSHQVLSGAHKYANNDRTMNQSKLAKGLYGRADCDEVERENDFVLDYAIDRVSHEFQHRILT